MARGRMISKSLSTSRKFAKLSSEFAQVLYVLIVAHADDFGRQSGDAFTVKHQVFPTSPRSEADFIAALDDLSGCGLIDRYDIDGETVLQVVSFEPHQTGLHKRSASRFPENPGSSGKFPEIPSELKGRELNRTEGKGVPPPLIESQRDRARRLQTCAFIGSRLEVPNTLHADLRKLLGGPDPDRVLEEWYIRLNTEIEETDEVIAPDVFKWLKTRFADWVKASAKAAKDAKLMAHLEAIERGEAKY